jgi:single-strand DNA-binding protein
MNCVILTGRLTADPDIKVSQDQKTVAHFTLAVDRGYKDQSGGSVADFIRCTCFDKRAQWMQSYTHKGMKLEVRGRWQTGSYTNKDGVKVYTNDCFCAEVNFGESKSASDANSRREGDFDGSRANIPPQYQNAPYDANSTPPAPSYVSSPTAPSAPTSQSGGLDGFMNIPDGIDEELPFN